MSAATWIAKFIFSFFALVVLDKGWNLLKTAIANRKLVKTAA